VIKRKSLSGSPCALQIVTGFVGARADDGVVVAWAAIGSTKTSSIVAATRQVMQPFPSRDERKCFILYQGENIAFRVFAEGQSAGTPPPYECHALAHMDTYMAAKEGTRLHRGVNGVNHNATTLRSATLDDSRDSPVARMTARSNVDSYGNSLDHRHISGARAIEASGCILGIDSRLYFHNDARVLRSARRSDQTRSREPRRVVGIRVPPLQPIPPLPPGEGGVRGS
jgi:hypothetical protein